MNNKSILLKIFTPRELYDMQLKYYSAVCLQPKNYYTEQNIILEKLGGMPEDKECDDD